VPGEDPSSEAAFPHPIFWDQGLLPGRPRASAVPHIQTSQLCPGSIAQGFAFEIFQIFKEG